MSTAHMITTATPAMHPRRGFTLVEMLIAIGVIVLLVALTVTAATALVQRSEVSATENVLKLLDLTIAEYETEAGRKPRMGPWFDSDFTACHEWELSEDTPPQLQATHIIGTTMFRQSASRAVFAQIDADYLAEFDFQGTMRPAWFTPADEAFIDDLCFARAASGGFDDETERHWFAPIDAWGAPIRLIYPGRVPDQRSFIGGQHVLSNPATFPIDEDETLITAIELELGRAVGRRVAFVSAGPDGRFGHLHLDIAEGNLSDDQRRDVEWAGDNVYSYQISRERLLP